MTLILINKVLIILYILSCLNVLRHVYYLIQTTMMTKNESSEKYRLSNKSLLILGISLAYLISIIFIGIKI